MKVIQIGNIGSSGHYFREYLRQNGHEAILIANENKILEGRPDTKLSWFNIKAILKEIKTADIVHIAAPNFKKLYRMIGLENFNKVKKILHWRGSDARRTYSTKYIFMWHGSGLRHPIKRFPLEHRILCKYADMHLYSTIDLRWFIKRLDRDKRCIHLRTPVDTDMFKPTVKWEDRPYEKLIWGKGRCKKDKWIPHNKVPELLNKYKYVETYPNDELSPKLVSISALEAAACGCKVVHHPYMTREWVKKHASVESQGKKLLKIYKELLDDEKE